MVVTVRMCPSPDRVIVYCRMIAPLSGGRVHVMRAAVTRAPGAPEPAAPAVVGAPAANRISTVAPADVWPVTLIRTCSGVVQLLPAGRWLSTKSSHPRGPGRGVQQLCLADRRLQADLNPSRAGGHHAVGAGAGPVLQPVGRSAGPDADRLKPGPVFSYGARVTVRVEVTVVELCSQPSRPCSRSRSARQPVAHRVDLVAVLDEVAVRRPRTVSDPPMLHTRDEACGSPRLWPCSCITTCWPIVLNSQTSGPGIVPLRGVPPGEQGRYITCRP